MNLNHDDCNPIPGIYYSHVPHARTEDHDGIYEDISEASKLANSLGKLSETRQSSSSLVSDDGVLEPDELRHMIQSFTTCPGVSYYAANGQ